MAQEQQEPEWLRMLREQQQQKKPLPEDQQEPDWLASLRAQQPGEQPRQAEDQWSQPGPPRVEDQEEPPWLADLQAQQLAGEPGAAGEPTDQPGPADMMESLREQMIQAGGTYEYERKPSLVHLFRNLEPWKRLVLAILLFLDVALCGCMALVMAGRVMWPF